MMKNAQVPGWAQGKCSVSGPSIPFPGQQFVCLGITGSDSFSSDLLLLTPLALLVPLPWHSKTFLWCPLYFFQP
jgi:hypothetical protein